MAASVGDFVMFVLLEMVIYGTSEWWSGDPYIQRLLSAAKLESSFLCIVDCFVSSQRSACRR